MTLDKMIARLEALKAEHGGRTPVRATDGSEYSEFVLHVVDTDGMGPLLLVDLTAADDDE